tara:strand:- start:6 stop:446 length:441 start_codon:yes stop_codon:yes gene_type:complete
MEKVKSFLNSWIEGVIEIGRVFLDGGDYHSCAEKFVSKHYAFDTDEVLFKPTFTKELIFRNTKDLALSYFVNGDINEDNGFALKPWEQIELDELTVLEEENLLAAMGTLKFKPLNSDEISLVAFTFCFINKVNSLKIKIHHSSPVL